MLLPLLVMALKPNVVATALIVAPVIITKVLLIVPKALHLLHPMIMLPILLLLISMDSP